MHVMQSEGLDFFCFIPRLMLPPKHLISDTPRIVGASEIRWKNHNHVYRKIVTNEYNQIMDVKNLDNSGTKQQTLDNTCSYKIRYIGRPLLMYSYVRNYLPKFAMFFWKVISDI